jgi:hypothetical protein
MNCAAVQNQILMQTDPRELPPALREHVGACAGCREWARKAARLESALEGLPAPAAPERKKEEMLGELMQAEPVIRPLPAPAARRGFGLVAVQFLRRNAAYVGGLAAAVLVAVGTYALWPGKGPEVVQAQPTQKYPLLDKLVKRDAELARANSTTKKLEVLSGMAEDISTEARGMARIAPGSELRQMAGWYEKTVKEGLVRQAGSPRLEKEVTTGAERAKLLESLAARLDADAAAAEALARESPPDAQPALQRMAEAAREGKDSLRAAARGGK